jgi:hypothetical protein
VRAAHNTITERVYEYICLNPGCTRKEILTIFPSSTKPRTVGILLSNLQRRGAIENRGGNTSRSRWYAVDIQVNEPYVTIADDLLTILEEAHPVVRKALLARRLEETFGDT